VRYTLLIRIILAAAVAALYLAHQDIWFWRSARPLVFGFLPIGLAYHAVYCVAAALLMWALTTFAWPAHLERVDGDDTFQRPTASSATKASEL
jgi:hypothetical protein